MISEKELLMLLVLMIVYSSFAMQLRPIPPIHHVHSNTAYSIMTTPSSLVDAKSGNFTQPGLLAKDCLTSIETTLEKKCQNMAEQNWDPIKLNSTTTTTWETCCSLFEELDCYVKNANTFCPKETSDAVIKYAKKIAYYFHGFICQSVSFSKWEIECKTDVHNLEEQNHKKELNDNPQLKPEFVGLPPTDDLENECFEKLRTGGKQNLEKICHDKSLQKWDPFRRKFMNSSVLESCCSIYDSLDCLVKQSATVCTKEHDHANMLNYRTKSTTLLASKVCHTIPYEKAGTLCKLDINNVVKSGSSNNSFLRSPSVTLLLLLMITIL